jgi:hypothetical protein
MAMRYNQLEFSSAANHLRSDPRHGWRLRGPQHVCYDGVALMSWGGARPGSDRKKVTKTKRMLAN